MAAVRGDVFAAALGLLLCQCAPDPPDALTAVAAPALLRVGSPITVTGRGLAGARLQLNGAPIDLALSDLRTDEAGQETATAEVAESAQWRAGQRFSAACLVGRDWLGWRNCAAIDARLRLDWQAGAIAVAGGDVQWGAALAVSAEDLLLPGEGTQAIAIDRGGEIVEMPLVTAAAAGRGRGDLRVDPRWTGPQPGPVQVRMRLQGAHRGAASQGPWSPLVALTVATPQLQPRPGQPDLRRGEPMPLLATGVSGPIALQLSGYFLSAPAGRGSNVQLPILPGRADTLLASSGWFLAAIAPAVAAGTPEFSGAAVLRVGEPPSQWLSLPVAVQWRAAPTVQRVLLVGGAGWQAGLSRLGMQALAAPIALAVRDRLQGLFAGYAVQVQWQDGTEGPAEWLKVHYYDRDPNGLGLLGAEAGPAKDQGNLVLDEDLGGVNWAARSLGLAAYGGVFVGEILGFSPKLHPGAAAASPALDAALAPWCPALGGVPARSQDQQKAATASAVVANVIAEVTAHEIGHALGLAAGTSDPHHAGDHPGWIMDAGTARPFAERAGLPGAAPSQWGAIDAAYLATILPAAAP